MLVLARKERLPFGHVPRMHVMLTVWLSLRGVSALAQGAVPTVGLRQEDNSWASKKYTHKFKSLNNSQMEKIAARTNEALLRSYIDSIMIPRIPGTPGHERVQAFITSTMHNLGWYITQDSFEQQTPHGFKSFNNIIATLPLTGATSGSSPGRAVLPVRRLTVACHYDSKYFRDHEFVAATDSAVPCAMMLHMAYTLDQLLKASTPKNNDVTIEFLFFDGEEAFGDWSDTDSIYGSKHLADLMGKTPHPGNEVQTTTRLDSMDFLMLLDLIGEAAPTFHNFFPQTSRHFERLIKIEKKMAKAGVLSEHCQNCNEYFRSDFVVTAAIEDDHIPFLRRGVPILHVIPYPFPSGWHNRGDDGSNLHYPTIFNLSKIFAAFVAEYLNLHV
jgi:glutaminyl-peptide cyclotransferase